MMSTTALRLSFAAALISAVASAADAQIDKSTPIIFDTEIVSLDLSGTATLPFGPLGTDVETQIIVSRATDHNSSRSNKTSSNAAAPDIDPDDLDGEVFDHFSTLDFKFDLTFIDIDPTADFDQLLGDTPVATLEGPVLADGDAGTFVFDKDEPGFGILSTKGAHRWTHRGHVTVLKAMLSGGGGGPTIGDIDFPIDGIALTFEPDQDVFRTLPNGDLEHTTAVTMDLTGTFGGEAFTAIGLSGTIVEQGQLTNQIVPEPAGLCLLAWTLLAGASRRKS